MCALRVHNRSCPTSTPCYPIELLSKCCLGRSTHCGNGRCLARKLGQACLQFPLAPSHLPIHLDVTSPLRTLAGTSKRLFRTVDALSRSIYRSCCKRIAAQSEIADRRKFCLRNPTA